MDRTCPKCRRNFGCSGNCTNGKEYRSEHSDSCLCPECLESTIVESVMSIFKSVNAYETGGGLLYSASFNGEQYQNMRELQVANTKLRKICNRTRKLGTDSDNSPKTKV